MGKTNKVRAGRPLDPNAGYRRIASKIRERIAHREYKPGELLPGLHRFAREFNVNANTVKAALNLLRTEGFVSLNAKRRLVVIPSSSAFHRQRPGYILEVTNHSLELGLRSAYFTELQRGIEIGAGLLNAPLIIAHASRYISMPAEEHFDHALRGIVLMGNFDPNVLRRYERLPVPVVLLDSPASNFQGHLVCVDNAKLGQQAANMLIARGHRRIAFLRYVHLRLKTIDPDALERQTAVTQAVGKSPEKVELGIYNFFHRDTAKSACFTRLFSARPRYTALVTVNMSQALIAKEAAALHGVQIPRDFEIITFKALTESEDIPGPKIDFCEMGRQAVLMLDQPRRPQLIQRLASNT